MRLSKCPSDKEVAAGREMDSTNTLDDELTANVVTAELDASVDDAPEPAPQPVSPSASAPPAASTSDVLLRGRYMLEEQIGEGGTSVVYRARDLRRDAAAPGGQRVALKLLRPGLRNHPRAVERLKREFHHAQTLSHPHIARVYDVDCESGAWFLTLELLEGETLGAMLARQTDPLPARRTLDILRACGEALAFAHERGVIHGDFKPGNVFITSAGQLRVLDFGAASASWLADAPGAMATPAYSSPEVLGGQRSERRDDVFSFACVAYELFTGQHPFGRRPSRESHSLPQVPDPAWNLSDRQWQALKVGLALSRHDRPSSVRAVLADLASTELPQSLRLPEFGESKTHFRASRLAPVGAIAALCALAAVLFVANWVLVDKPRAQLDNKATDATTAAASSELPGTGPAATSPEPMPRPGMVPAVQRNVVPDSARGELATPTAPPPIRNAALTLPPPAAAGTPLTQGLVPLVSFDVDAVIVNEGAVSAVLRVNRRQQLNGRVQVRWRTLAGSARPGQDYRQAAEGTAEFADGQATRAIYVPLLNDLLAERDEGFAVELYAPGGTARINPIGRVRVTLRDDDLPRG